ncbi:MAG TPA: hypothetical protein PKX04_06625 [Chitinophagales bacterium]|nr:hypothetical protein [Chitinophagales bacterium]HPE97613.1 hypothetical protein [Chitinophagales bacterium]
MIRLFRSVTPFSLLAGLLYLAAMSLHLFLHPVVPDLRPLQEPYSDWFPVAQWSGHDLYMIVLLALLMTAAFMVSVTAAGASFTHGLSPLPAIVYLTLCFLVPDAFIHPVSVITVTGFLRLYQLIFNSYNKQQADSLLLNAGIWCGILSLLEPAYILIVVPVVIGFSTIRTLTFRESLVILSGTLVMHFLAVTAMLLFGKSDWYLAAWKNWHIPGQDGWPHWLILIQLALALMFLLAATAYLTQHLNNQLIRFRRNTRVLLVFLLGALLLALILPAGVTAVWWWIAAPAALMISWWWTQMKNQDAAAILHLTLLGLVFVFQYINFA